MFLTSLNSNPELLIKLVERNLCIQADLYAPDTCHS